VTAGLILAGGAGSRMGGVPKAHLTLGGETFLARLVRLFAAAGCGPIAVVEGAHRLDVPPPAFAVAAPDWSRGMRASLRAGLAALPPGPVLLTHADRPLVEPATLTALLVAPAGRPAIPVHAGRRGHPVRLPAALRDRLLEEDDTPLRDVLTAYDVFYLIVDDPGVLLDVDTPSEYQALHARFEGAGSR
jgi:nicotine blue oxidoreductase